MKYTTSYPELLEFLKDELVKDLGINVDPDRVTFLGTYLHLLSVLSANELYYIQMLANESFLSRALLESSILEHAKSLGYAPKNAIPASGNLTLSIPVSSLSFKIDVQNLTFTDRATKQIQYIVPGRLTIEYNANRGIYVSELKDVLGRTTTLSNYIGSVNTPQGVVTAFNVVVPVVQSNSVDIVYVLKESDVANLNTPTINIPLNAYFSEEELNRQFLSEVKVSVSGIEYKQYPSLFLMSKGEFGYVLRKDSNQVSIILGNGVFGVQEREGSVVVITLSTTLGAYGNVGANSLTLKEPLRDEYSKSPLVAYMFHDAFSNGTNGETPHEVRLNTIASLRSQDRLVSWGDIVDVFQLQRIEAFPIVKKSDLEANETTIYIVPTFLNKPIKCTSGSISTTLQNWPPSDPQTVVVNKGDQVEIDGITFVSPVEAVLDTSQTVPYIKYMYIPEEATYPVTTVESRVSPNDRTTKAQIQSFTIRYDAQNSYFILQCRVLASWPNQQQQFSDLFRVWAKLTDTTTNTSRSYELQNPQKDGDAFVLTVNLPTTEVSSSLYFLDCSVTSVDQQFTYFMGYKTGLRIKVSLEDVLPTKYKRDNTTITLYDVPLVEKNVWETGGASLDYRLFEVFSSLKTVVSQKRMITNKINVAFAKTCGKIVNIKYNTSSSRFVYDQSCIGTIDLPLRLQLNVLLESGSSSEIINTITSKVYSYLESVKGIHKSVILEDIIKIVKEVEGVIACDVVSPLVSIDYNFTISNVPKPEVLTFVPEYIWCESPNDIIITIVSQMEQTC